MRVQFVQKLVNSCADFVRRVATLKRANDLDQYLAHPLWIVFQTGSNDGVCQGALGLRGTLRPWCLVLSKVETRAAQHNALECPSAEKVALTWFYRRGF